jgi:hypothetical protein
VSFGCISRNPRVNGRSLATSPICLTCNHVRSYPCHGRLATHSRHPLSPRMSYTSSSLFRNQVNPTKVDAGRRKRKHHEREIRLICTTSLCNNSSWTVLTAVGENAIYAEIPSLRISDLLSQSGLENNVSSLINSASCPATPVTAGNRNLASPFDHLQISLTLVATLSIILTGTK